ARCNVDSVAEYIVGLPDNISHIDADAKLNAFLEWYFHIALNHTALDFNGALHRVHRACELNQHAIAGRLDDVPSVFLYLGIAKLTAVLFEFNKGSPPAVSH